MADTEGGLTRGQKEDEEEVGVRRTGRTLEKKKLRDKKGDSTDSQETSDADYSRFLSWGERGET